MRIAIFGVGGVGGYFGGRLAQAGQAEVIFIARGAHLDALKKHGLQVFCALYRGGIGFYCGVIFFVARHN